VEEHPSFHPACPSAPLIAPTMQWPCPSPRVDTGVREEGLPGGDVARTCRIVEDASQSYNKEHGGIRQGVARGARGAGGERSGEQIVDRKQPQLNSPCSAGPESQRRERHAAGRPPREALSVARTLTAALHPVRLSRVLCSLYSSRVDTGLFEEGLHDGGVARPSRCVERGAATLQRKGRARKRCGNVTKGGHWGDGGGHSIPW